MRPALVAALLLSLAPVARPFGDAVASYTVTFDVVLDGRVTLDLLVAETRYRGPFGEYSGTLRPSDGPEVDLSGAFGMGEDFHLRT